MSRPVELLERLRRGPALVAAAVAGASEAELDHSPGPSQWTARQVMCHMADSEIVGADRFRRVIAEDNPTMIGYNEKAWALKLDYGYRPAVTALEVFRVVRQATYDLLKDLPEAAFQRAGVHTEHGKITVLELLDIYARHAESHARQIERARESWRNSRR